MHKKVNKEVNKANKFIEEYYAKNNTSFVYHCQLSIESTVVLHKLETI